MKITILLIVVLLAIMETIQAGKVNNETLRDYYWNWCLWIISTDKLLTCNFIGIFGLIFFNDNGAMAENCFRTDIQGGRASFSGFPKYRYIKKNKFELK